MMALRSVECDHNQLNLNFTLTHNTADGERRGRVPRTSPSSATLVQPQGKFNEIFYVQDN